MRNSRLRVLNVVGARPNFVKMAALYHEYRRHPDIQTLLIHTGQHYDYGMSKAFFDELGLPEPDVNLNVGSGSHAKQTAEIMLGVDGLVWVPPDVMVVVGDVNSTLAAALVAAKRDIPVAHVEAGLRSLDTSMPEEVNRRLTDHVSTFLFTTEESANRNLKREGIDGERIHFVGNVMVDTLLRYHDRALGTPSPVDVLDYVVITLHRPSNVDDKEKLERIIEALREVSTLVSVVFPCHGRTRKRLLEFELLEKLDEHVILLPTLDYFSFVRLTSQAKLVLTDSGGVQEETTVLGVPCLTFRPATERPATLEGTNRIIGNKPACIPLEVGRILSGDIPSGRIPELWDGRAAERIVDILRERR